MNSVTLEDRPLQASPTVRNAGTQAGCDTDDHASVLSDEQSRKDQMQAYFSTLMQGLPDGYFGYLWLKRPRLDVMTGKQAVDGTGRPAIDSQTYWINDPIKAAGACLLIQKRMKSTEDLRYDVYFGRGISKGKRGQHERVGNSNADGILDFCLDLDYGTEGHQKEGYPADEAEVLSLLDKVKETGLRFTVVLNSGHGLQVRIRLDKPWVFSDEEDRKRAYELSQRLQSLFSAIWESEGYRLDSTMDLGRVLRVPGTFNYKLADHPCEVRLMQQYSDPKAAVTIEALDSMLPALTKTDRRIVQVHQTVSADVADLVLDPGAQPDQQKLAELVKSDSVVRSVLSPSGTPVDANGTPFQSTSERDLSVATRAARYGWSPQEIMDLVIHSRRINGDDLKLERRMRYLSTVEKAVAESMPSYGCTEAEAMRLFDAGERLQDEDRECLHDAIALRLGLPELRKVTAVRKCRASDGTHFTIELDNRGEVSFDCITALSSKSQIIKAFVDAVGFYPEPGKAKKLNDLGKMVVAAAVDDDLGVESPEDHLRAALKRYFQTHHVYDDAVLAFDSQSPYYEQSERMLWFKAKRFFEAEGCDPRAEHKWSRLFPKIGVERQMTKNLADGRSPKAHRVRIDLLFDEHEIKRLFSDWAMDQ